MNNNSNYTCQTCGAEFQLSDTISQKYPNWTPKKCGKCHSPSKSKANTQSSTIGTATVSSNELHSGLFTDGSSYPNPGPGGWGYVYVLNNNIIRENSGFSPQTTNNRMELYALIEGCRILPFDTVINIYSDSQLCVRTINEWVPKWEKNGWRKSKGEIKNLDLIKELYGLIQSRPKVILNWLPAHCGYRWNEYADQLASSYNKK